MKFLQFLIIFGFLFSNFLMAEPSKLLGFVNQSSSLIPGFIYIKKESKIFYQEGEKFVLATCPSSVMEVLPTLEKCTEDVFKANVKDTIQLAKEMLEFKINEVRRDLESRQKFQQENSEDVLKLKKLIEAEEKGVIETKNNVNRIAREIKESDDLRKTLLNDLFLASKQIEKYLKDNRIKDAEELRQTLKKMQERINELVEENERLETIKNEQSKILIVSEEALKSYQNNLKNQLVLRDINSVPSLIQLKKELETFSKSLEEGEVKNILEDKEIFEKVEESKLETALIFKHLLAAFKIQVISDRLAVGLSAREYKIRSGVVSNHRTESQVTFDSFTLGPTSYVVEKYERVGIDLGFSGIHLEFRVSPRPHNEVTSQPVQDQRFSKLRCTLGKKGSIQCRNYNQNFLEELEGHGKCEVLPEYYWSYYNELKASKYHCACFCEVAKENQKFLNNMDIEFIDNQIEIKYFPLTLESNGVMSKIKKPEVFNYKLYGTVVNGDSFELSKCYAQSNIAKSCHSAKHRRVTVQKINK